MQAKPLRGIHVFWMVAAFFAAVISVDAYFIFGAITSFPGEQVKNSYVLGLDYNREVESRERQALLGWTAEAGLQQDDGLSLVLRLKGRDAEPVSGLVVSASYHVAGQGRGEYDAELIEGAPGQYAARIDVPANARIEVKFAARHTQGEAVVFEAGKTLVTS
jgi:nitrogen fixation protein FixH